MNSGTLIFTPGKWLEFITERTQRDEGKVKQSPLSAISVSTSGFFKLLFLAALRDALLPRSFPGLKPGAIFVFPSGERLKLFFPDKNLYK
jgi:hypothetical protein